MQKTTSIIRSFVRREGRFTKGQQHAIEKYWPRYGIELDFERIKLQKIFANEHACILDVGFGNGEALIKLAEQHPCLNFLGVEVYRPGIGSLLRKIVAAQVNNVRVINIDVMEFLQKNILTTSLAAILIWFPDPWPKKRHHKRRLINKNFLQLAAEKIKPKGELHIATDWQPYAEHIQETFINSGLFEEVGVSKVIKQRPQTKFERRGNKLGHKIYEFIFQKIETK